MDSRFASFNNFFKAGLVEVVQDAWVAVREFVGQYSTDDMRKANMTRLDSLIGKDSDVYESPSPSLTPYHPHHLLYIISRVGWEGNIIASLNQ